MITATWNNLAPSPDTWIDFTFNNLSTTTWLQIFNSYVITDPSLEVVNGIYGEPECVEEDPDYLPTIVVYDTIAPEGEEYSSENTNIIRLLNKKCPINMKWVNRIYLILPDNTYFTSQILPNEIYWDDWFIYLQLGKNNLWVDQGEGYFRVRILVKIDGSTVPFFWGFLRIKVLLGQEVI